MAKRPEFHERYFNPNAELPYGADPGEVKEAIQETYRLYGDMNNYLLEEGHGRLETLIRANNALSDFMGNVATEAFATASDDLHINEKPDGFPDILPVDYYDSTEVHHGAEGIETKCSKASGGWNAHNNESGWFLIFRYDRGDPDDEPNDMAPIHFVQVMAASLVEDDWSHSSRSEESRRTITSAIKEPGMHKLRSNPVYEDPEYISGRAGRKQEYYRNHAQFDPVFAEENPDYTEQQTLDS